MAPIARLHLITPNSTDTSVAARTALALAAGVSWVQIRVKGGCDEDHLGFAQTIGALTVDRSGTCIVDDRVDIALAVGAAGVHLGIGDLPVAVARRVLGPAAIIGATCRTPDDARRAVDDGASYLGVGPVYATTTKVGLPDPIGLAGLRAVTAAVSLPVIAISGITAARVAEVLHAGAFGVAVVAAVYDAPDIGAEVAAFLAELPSESADLEQAAIRTTT